MSSSLPGNNNPSNSGRLNGWKEISAYLQKSVRTVQRWEKDLQLPVHRIHGNGGEIVFAQVDEIEAWLHGTRQERLADAKENESGEHAIAAHQNGSSTPPPTVVQPISKHWRWVAIASTAALVTVVAGWALTQRASAPAVSDVPRKVVDWTVERGVFWALDADKHRLWNYQPDPPLNDESYQGAQTRPTQAVIADLDGDGQSEVVFLGLGKGPATLHVLEANGRLRFTYRPQHEMTFGAKLQGPPWPLLAISVVRNPNGTGDIWLRAQHHLWYPSPLIKLDRRDGKVLSEYWSAGHITFEREATIGGRRVMMVGATNNDSKGASLAVLDYNNANGFSPTLNSEYSCSSCPSGGLLQFLLFPRMELANVTESRPNVTFVRLDGSGLPLIDVTHGSTRLPPDNKEIAGTAFYALMGDFRVSEAETGDSYRQVHAMLELAGAIKHPFSLTCEKQLFPVLRWNGREFVEETGTLGSPPRANRPIVAGKADKTRLSPAALRR